MKAKRDLGWISVKDRLPEKSGYYITCVAEYYKQEHVPQCVGVTLFNGMYWEDDDEPEEKELVDSEAFAPKEPKLTEFEEMLYSIFDAYNGLEIDVRAAVDVNAKTLLELAKKEICMGCTVGLDQYWKGREDARKEYEKPITYHYPTYGPPCFHGGICTNPMRDCINCPMHSSGATINTTSGTCKRED